MTQTTIHIGDCLAAMRTMPDASVDAIVTDPPYGLGREPDVAAMVTDWLAGRDHVPRSTRGFMGKEWDAFVPGPSMWREALRVLKPGGHLVAFFGTRTYDLGVLAIRWAGFEIRDQLAWTFGSGFPKSLDVSKAIDDAAGVEREVVGERKKLQSFGESVNNVYGSAPDKGGVQIITAPATDAARQWQGWGTSMKPAYEPVVLARKPLVGTVADNVLTHGTGALNVDGCRVPMSSDDAETIRNMGGFGKSGYVRTPGEALNLNKNPMPCVDSSPNDAGRWPANLVHDGSPEVTDHLGDAARFFYCAKASVEDREEGLDHLPARKVDESREDDAPGGDNPRNRGVRQRRNHHATVKPTALMRWLVRLVTPPGGTVLDPFMGSGSTGKACVLEGFDFIGCELDPEYAQIARARIDYAGRQGRLL